LLSAHAVYSGRYVWIGAASTKIAAHPFPDFFNVRSVSLLDAGNRRNDLTACTETALKTIALDECLLHRMKIFARSQAFNGCNFSLVSSLKLPRLAQQQHYHHTPNSQKRIGDGETNGETERRDAAMSRILNYRQCGA